MVKLKLRKRKNKADMQSDGAEFIIFTGNSYSDILFVWYDTLWLS